MTEIEQEAELEKLLRTNVNLWRETASLNDQPDRARAALAKAAHVPSMQVEWQLDDSVVTVPAILGAYDMQETGALPKTDDVMRWLGERNATQYRLDQINRLLLQCNIDQSLIPQWTCRARHQRSWHALCFSRYDRASLSGPLSTIRSRQRGMMRISVPIEDCDHL